ncbi:sodium/glutamate symporter [Kiritimatiellaeota bacterium B1221]|nr:sodium/glutamate symporter [Kiritimatiellaeota bacterium B1221]
MEPFQLIVLALGFAVGLSFLGEWIRTLIPGLRQVFIPGAVIGGTAALLMGPQLNPALTEGAGFAKVYETLSRFPSVFITVVFACLMLARPIAKFSTILRRAGPQIVMGHVYAWGQYVIGIGVTLLILGPVFSLNELAGASIAIGFQGGHGTAAGLQSTFEKLGFEDGYTIAYAVATFGILSAAIFGPLLATALRRKGKEALKENTSEPGEPAVEKDTDEEEDSGISFSPLTGKLTLHLALIGGVILMGWLFLQGGQHLEEWIRSGEVETLYTSYIPLFSVVLIMAFFLQWVLQGLGWDRVFDRSLIDHVSAFALDMVLFGALATLNLSTIGKQWVPILILCVAGLSWNLCVFFLLGPRVYPKPWFPYGLGDLGGGTASTASGLLLIRVADPKKQTSAKQAYSEKQPLYEPFMGGGLVTAFALPVMVGLGAWAALGITVVILGIWLGVVMRIRQKE